MPDALPMRLQQALRALNPQELTPEQADGLAEETRQTTVSRLRAVLPLMILVNVAHALAANPASVLRHGDYSIQVLAWADGIMFVHLITALFALIPGVMVLRDRPPQWVGPLAVAIYMVHGAAVAAMDQLNSQTILPYVGYAFVNAVLVPMRLRDASAAYLASGAALCWYIVATQPSAEVRMGVIPVALSILVPALSMVWFLNMSRRNTYFLRETIAAQRVELQQHNRHLQAQVEAQVATLVQRAREVEQLNEFLRERVNDRSKRLADALKKLDLQEGRRIGEVGSVLAGRFRLGGEIGVGGMGVVFEAEDLQTGTAVAVKMMGPDRISPESADRFLREVQSASAIRHPSIVQMLHVDVADSGRLFQVQELVRGTTLSRWLGRVEHFDVQVAVAVIQALCDALAAAHGQNVVHRDVKPSNLMLVPRGHGIVLLDFGIAKVHQVETPTATAALGTPSYMAPELWGATPLLTPAADIYAVGICAFRMLAGALPDRTKGPASFAGLGLSASQVALLERAVSDSPTDRPTAGELAAGMVPQLAVSLAARVADGTLGPLREDSMEVGDFTHLSFGN